MAGLPSDAGWFGGGISISVGVGHVDDVQPAHLCAVDAAVREARDGIVAHLDEQTVGAVEVERKLLGTIGRELMAAGLRETTEDSEIVRSQDLAESKLDLLRTLRAVAPSELHRV
jgi:hypothetical protein